MLPYADVCRRMPTYADVCRRILTYAPYTTVLLYRWGEEWEVASIAPDPPARLSCSVLVFSSAGEAPAFTALSMCCCFTYSFIILYCFTFALATHLSGSSFRLLPRVSPSAALLMLYLCLTYALLLYLCVLMLYGCFTAALLMMYCCLTYSLLLLYL